MMLNLDACGTDKTCRPYHGSSRGRAVAEWRGRACRARQCRQLWPQRSPPSSPVYPALTDRQCAAGRGERRHTRPPAPPRPRQHHALTWRTRQRLPSPGCALPFRRNRCRRHRAGKAAHHRWTPARSLGGRYRLASDVWQRSCPALPDGRKWHRDFRTAAWHALLTCLGLVLDVQGSPEATRQQPERGQGGLCGEDGNVSRPGLCQALADQLHWQHRQLREGQVGHRLSNNLGRGGHVRAWLASLACGFGKGLGLPRDRLRQENHATILIGHEVVDTPCSRSPSAVGDRADRHLQRW